MIENDEIVPPTSEHMGQIREWLKKEADELGGGFWCNINIIERLFQAGNIVCVVREGEAIGFAVWDASDFVAEIVIVEVIPVHRQEGLGKKLVVHVKELLRDQGVWVIEGECKPHASLEFWQHMGFERNPHDKNGNPCISLPLIESLACSTSSNADTELPRLSLWASEPGARDGCDPACIFDLPQASHGFIVLELRILLRFKPDWCALLEVPGEWIFDDKVKRLTSDHPVRSGFLCLDEIALPLDNGEVPYGWRRPQ